MLEVLGLKIKLAAPTGRAAKRLSKATGYPAATLHRLLHSNSDGSFAHNKENKLKADAVLVDETSMLDTQLCLSLLRALPLSCRLVLVGDVNQLPSVGPGNVLGEILESGVLEQTKLTHIYRQALQSMIVVNAHRVNQGQFPKQSNEEPPLADFFWVECDDPQIVQEEFVNGGRAHTKNLGYDPKRASSKFYRPCTKGKWAPRP